jgi:hypothetical protein
MRENLIQEQRTDKNGVTSRRWVRPANGTSKGKPLPSPSAKASSSLAMSNDDLLATISLDNNYYQPDGLDQAVNNTRRVCPETLELAVRLTTTGTPQGRSVASGAVMESLHNVAILYARYGDNNPEEIESNAGVETRISMISGWHTHSLFAEIGEPVSHDDFRRLRAMVWDSHYYNYRDRKGETSTKREVPDDAYWRGCTALQFIRLDEKQGKNDNAKDMEFIFWAGKQDDIVAVIELAKERGTTDVETLRSILSLPIPKSMRDGAL